MLSLRARLLAISLTVMGVVGIATGVWLETAIVEQLLPRAQAELVSHAELADQATRGLAATELQDRVAELAKTLDQRVRILGPEGRVLADASADEPGYGCEAADLEGLTGATLVTRSVDARDWQGWVAIIVRPQGGAVCVSAEPEGLRGTLDLIRIAVLGLGLVAMVFAFVMSSYAARSIAGPTTGRPDSSRA